MHRRHQHGHGRWEDRHAAFGPFGPWGQWQAPFGGHGPFGHGRGRRGARRGDVRAAILALLAERPMHGYEMIQELQQRTGGMWRPSPGSVYPTLQMLEEEGLVTGEQAEGKRRFSLTESGRAEAERITASQAPWEEVAEGVGPTAFRMRDAIGGILGAVRQVAFAGSEQQQARAIEILTEARRRLYALLAEEGPGEERTGEQGPNV
ncbi:MAG TPA: PadR family transcriptional regulator [Actinomycetes bacterium]|nr:PadR family transcriptional regulator [Actinomycetes bacterium]